MARFSAPADTAGVTLNCGQFAAVDGFVTIDCEIGEGDRAGLFANGFRPAPIAAALAPASPAPVPVKRDAPDEHDPE